MFAVGQWVWYYYPHRYQHRTPKWCKTFNGPFLITKVIPCDYVIQKTARTAPITVHREKMKICHGATPKSWLTSATQEVQHDARQLDDQDGSEIRQDEVTESPRREEAAAQHEQRRYRRRQEQIDYGDGEIEIQKILSQRNRRIPPRFRDYRM